MHVNIPAFERLREQQLELQFVVMSLASEGVGDRVVGFDVVALNLLYDLVGFADLLVLHIKHGINEMLALEGTDAVLPTKACEDGAVIEGGLSVEVELGRPPRRGAIFQLDPGGMKVVAAALRAKCREILDL